MYSQNADPQVSDEQRHLDLARLDTALARVRRLWESPELRRQFLARLGRPVDPSTIRVLRAIERVPVVEPGVRSVAELLFIDNSTASRLIDSAVATGLVSREPSEQDRRRSVLALTPEGLELLAAATSVRAGLLAEITAGWSHESRTTLARLLEDFSEGIAGVESRQ